MNGPQIYLSTPLLSDGQDFAPVLSALLDKHAIACVRFRTGSTSEAEIGKTAELLRNVCRIRDVPIVIETHFRLVPSLGLDGVHLLNAASSVREARKALGKDQIVGAFCGTSRHVGMAAAELGCDYVEFGPVGRPNLLGDGKRAERELFEWWDEMIEVPVVAEGEITPDIAIELAPYVDFLCLGEELWLHPDGPEQALDLILSAFR